MVWVGGHDIVLWIGSETCPLRSSLVEKSVLDSGAGSEEEMTHKETCYESSNPDETLAADGGANGLVKDASSGRIVKGVHSHVVRRR